MKNCEELIIELKKYSKAIECFDKTIELEPFHYQAFVDKGICLNNLKQYEEALHFFDMSIETKPCFARAYFFKGVAYYGLNKFQNSNIYFNKAIELDTNYEGELKNELYNLVFINYDD